MVFPKLLQRVVLVFESQRYSLDVSLVRCELLIFLFLLLLLEMHFIIIILERGPPHFNCLLHGVGEYRCRLCEHEPTIWCFVIVLENFLAERTRSLLCNFLRLLLNGLNLGILILLEHFLSFILHLLH